ncbi:MAG: SDR family oxidoreductase [Hyphomonas sp.]
MTPGLALVTGAGKRLGKAMALALAEDGWDVGIHYNHSEAAASEVVSLIEAMGRKAVAFQADLSDEAQTGALIRAVSGSFGQSVALLVNSASTFDEDTALGHDRASWDHHMLPNLRAPILLSQEMARALPKDQSGLIVNLIDQRVWKLTPQFFTYTLSKAALWQATQTLAQALAPNIRVNGIGPGPTLKNVHQSDDDFTAESRATLTQRGSDPEEIVRALRYLVSAHSVTGQMIASDGGQHLMWQTPDTQI